MAEEKQEIIEAEIVEEKKGDGEKKENGFSKWWKKTKQNISDSMLESNIESQWSKDHDQFDIYIYGGSIFDGACVKGEVKDSVLTYFGTREIKPHSVIIDKKTSAAYYAGSSKKVVVGVDYEGIHYDRDGTELELDPSVSEVKVIKAGDRYFLYKGE